MNHRLYKKEVDFENYLEILKDLFLLCCFPTSNHRLPIEIDRWQHITWENIVCNLRQMHWFNHDIARLIPQNYRCSWNAVKYYALTCSNYVVELNKLCKFIRIVNNIVCPLVSVDFYTLIWCKYIFIFDIYLLVNNTNQYRYIAGYTVYRFNENHIFILSFLLASRQKEYF